MKQLFFTAAAIAIPASILLWLVWVFVKGIYTVASDVRLNRELKQIRRESANGSRKSSSSTESTGEKYSSSGPAQFISDEPID